MYPAFSPPKTQEDAAAIMQSEKFGRAIGHHEVLVESPVHRDHPADAPIPQLVHLVNAYRDRFSDLAQKQYVKYVQIFRNYGLQAGASLSHAHSQIIATPFVPAIPNEEMVAAKSYFDEHGTCFFCDLIEKEKLTNRQIMENDEFSVFAPYASVHPMEFWVLPKSHSSNILNLSMKATGLFAQTMKATLGALKATVSDPPYNYGIHQGISEDMADSYHWHLEVYPSLSTWAGFEKSTGAYINTVTPETAAEEFKKALRV